MVRFLFLPLQNSGKKSQTGWSRLLILPSSCAIPTNKLTILYAIETSDGRKGVLIDAYGLYADDDTSSFMQEVEIFKKTVSRSANAV